ncbi:MAG: PAS domain-containing sensor histidine kinase [Winogradskyella sp.]
MKHYLEQELEDLLKADGKLFKFIQNHSLDGMWYWDLENQNEEYMDQRFWHVLGYDPKTKKHSPQEWIELIDPEHLELAKDNLSKHLEDENHPYDQVVRYKHKSGKDIWVRCRGIAIRDNNGKPIRLLGCHNDITDLKEREIESQEMLMSYKALVETESLFYIKTDVQGNYTYANNCFLNRFGYKLEDIIGKSSMCSIIEEDHPKTFKIVAKCFAEPNIPHSIILRKPYKDGLTRSNHWEFYGITDNNNDVIEIVCIGVEITELVDRSIQLQRLLDVEADKNDRLQQHSYITSHNIRNSVANMVGLVDMIEDDPDNLKEYVDMMKSSVHALDATLKNLTKLLTEEKEAEFAQLENINVTDALKRIIALETGEISNLNANIEINGPENIILKTLPVFFDSIFHNLISNALKYGINNTSNLIEVNIGYEDENLFIEIKDFGDGFNLPNNAELLFRLGTRLDSNKIGQGLGLFITKHHAKTIGANIAVTSIEGKGAAFKVIWND